MTALYISVPGDTHFMHMITSDEGKEELEKQSKTKQSIQEKNGNNLYGKIKSNSLGVFRSAGFHLCGNYVIY